MVLEEMRVGYRASVVPRGPRPLHSCRFKDPSTLSSRWCLVYVRVLKMCIPLQCILQIQSIYPLHFFTYIFVWHLLLGLRLGLGLCLGIPWIGASSMLLRVARFNCRYRECCFCLIVSLRSMHQLFICHDTDVIIQLSQPTEFILKLTPKLSRFVKLN